MQKLINFAVMIIVLVCIIFMSPSIVHAVETEISEPAENIIESGICGTILRWTFDESGTLTISGNGSMSSYEYSTSYSPWFKYRYSINKIVIADGVTSIGDYAFYLCKNVTSISIPNSVTTIGVYAFKDCAGLSNINISNGVTTINAGAFKGCSGLSSITIPESVTTINNGAFSECVGLIEINYNATMMADRASGNSVFTNAGANNTGIMVNIGQNVEHIPSYLFAYNKYITEVIFDDNSVCQSIGFYSFTECTGLKRVVIPKSVASIGHHAFYHCTSLESVAIPNGVKTIEYYTFGYCTNLCSATIPNSITSIGNFAFYNCTSLKSATIPDSVTTIGMSSFKNCENMTNVTLGKNINTIGENAFSFCYKLVDINLPDGITSIGSSAFYSCDSLTSVAIPNSVTVITNAFSGCNNITTVVIPNSVTTINNYAFYYCTKLDNVILPNSVTSIGEYAFYSCSSLTNIVIPESVTTIGTYAFGECSGLTSLVSTPGITSISAYMYGFCTGLTNISIPDGTTSIGELSFWGCENLKSVTIPLSLSYIGSSAFSSCHNLTDIYYEGTEEIWNEIDNNDYSGSFQTAQIHFLSIHEHSLVSYAGKAPTCTNVGWEDYETCKTCIYTTYKEIPATGHVYSAVITPPTCTEQGYTTYTCFCGDTYTNTYVAALDHQSVNGVCSNCGESLPYLDKGDCGKSVTWLLGTDGTLTISGSGTMSSYSYSTSYSPWYQYRNSINSVVIEHGVTSIGNYAFYYCNKITTIVLPNSITKIGSYAFYNCYKLTSITIPSGVSTILSSAFALCDNLQEISLPISVTNIEPLAFNYCDNLKKVYFYCGSQSAWDSIKIGSYNDPIKNATIEFHLWKNQNTTGSKKCAACGYGTTYLGLTSVTIRPSAAGIYFTGTFEVQDDVDVVRKGIAVSIYNQMPVADGSDPQSLWSEGTTSVLVSNILNQRASDSSNATRAATPIYARAYIELSDGTYIYSDVVSTNLREVTEAADTQWATLDDTQKAAITAMYTKFKSILDDWNLSFAESKPIDPAEDVLIISNTQTISNQTIDKDVYITFTGVAIFENVTINGNIYCYGQLIASSCTANDVYAYAYGTMMSCDAFDGTHGKVSGGINCNTLIVQDDALDYAFNKWGK